MDTIEDKNRVTRDSRNHNSILSQPLLIVMMIRMMMMIMSVMMMMVMI